MKNLFFSVIVIVVLAVSVLASVEILSVHVPGASTTETGTTGTNTSTAGKTLVLNKAQSGLVASDPLNGYATQQQLQANGSYWSYGGTANSSSYYSFYESADKLNIGIVAPDSGEWSGFYAVTPPTYADLVHAVLTVSTGEVSGYYDTGLYMQSTNELINYLTCLAITTPSGTTWGVVHGYGTQLQDVVIDPLWVDTASDQPLTEDCTLTTNGQNSIAVYLDHQEVYSSNTSSLGMPGPYNFFVEEESEYAGQILYGGYQDFYATLNNTIAVTDIPSSATTVALVNQTGQVYATAPVSHGSALLGVGEYTFPLAGYVKVYDSSSMSASSEVAATPLEQVYGGDVYTFGSAAPKTISLSVSAQDTSGHDLNGYYITVSQGHNTIQNGSTPYTFTGLDASTTYTITAYDYGSYVFDHWSDGSTSRTISVFLTKDTDLVAVYRSVDSPPPEGQSAVSVQATDSSGASLTGFSVTIWQDGVLYGVSYTPASFYLDTGTTYLMAAAGYNGYAFSNWQNGPDTAYYEITPETQTMSLVAVYNYTG